MRIGWKSCIAASVSALALCGAAFMAVGAPANSEGPAKYKYDPNWPKPLPANWALGGITGMFVDRNDHIWVLNRPSDLDETNNYATLNPPAAECCISAPAVLEFDAEGNLLKSWGKHNEVPGWPKSEHTIFTDRAGNVYIAGAQPGDTIVKFTADGKFISEFGHRGPAVENRGQKENNQQTDLLLRGVNLRLRTSSFEQHELAPRTHEWSCHRNQRAKCTHSTRRDDIHGLRGCPLFGACANDRDILELQCMSLLRQPRDAPLHRGNRGGDHRPADRAPAAGDGVGPSGNTLYVIRLTYERAESNLFLGSDRSATEPRSAFGWVHS